MKKVFIITANMVDPEFAAAPKANLFLVQYPNKAAEFHPNDKHAVEFDSKGKAEECLQSIPTKENVYYLVTETYKKVAW